MLKLERLLKMLASYPFYVPTVAQLAERRTVEAISAVILRSPVQIWFVGHVFFHYMYQNPYIQCNHARATFSRLTNLSYNHENRSINFHGNLFIIDVISSDKVFEKLQ